MNILRKYTYMDEVSQISLNLSDWLRAKELGRVGVPED